MEFRMISLGEVTSTNDVAMQNVTVYGHGSVLTARRQTAGRGQRGNRWESAPGENLMFSLVLEPEHILVEHQFWVSEMAAMAASDAVREVTGGAVECRVKWPNDLYVGDRKVGGILIEHSLHSEYLSRSVVGIGINVCQRAFDPSLSNPTSIANELDPAVVSNSVLGSASDSVVDSVLDSVSASDSVSVLASVGVRVIPSPQGVLEAFCDAFSRRWMQEEGALHVEYLTRLWRGDSQRYPYRDATTGELFEAVIGGVDPYSGELTLRVDHPEGDLRHYWFKEVEAIF